MLQKSKLVNLSLIAFLISSSLVGLVAAQTLPSCSGTTLQPFEYYSVRLENVEVGATISWDFWIDSFEEVEVALYSETQFQNKLAGQTFSTYILAVGWLGTDSYTLTSYMANQLVHTGVYYVLFENNREESSICLMKNDVTVQNPTTGGGSLWWIWLVVICAGGGVAVVLVVVWNRKKKGW
ncbi:MAG: hypothetical protein ACTSU5_16600 [Promethearchaeota archaeon]